MLTIKAQIHADPETERVLLAAVFCATKVYNGLMWQLRLQQEEIGLRCPPVQPQPHPRHSSQG